MSIHAAHITIERAYYRDCTLGRLFAPQAFQCFTLELPWLANANDISCIPEGIYDYEIKPSPRLRGALVVWILGVPNRTAVQIHWGNYTRDILGCILTGDSTKFLDSDSIPDVTNSNATFKKFLTTIPTKGKIRFTSTKYEAGKYVSLV